VTMDTVKLLLLFFNCIFIVISSQRLVKLCCNFYLHSLTVSISTGVLQSCKDLSNVNKDKDTFILQFQSMACGHRCYCNGLNIQHTRRPSRITEWTSTYPTYHGSSLQCMPHRQVSCGKLSSSSRILTVTQVTSMQHNLYFRDVNPFSSSMGIT
jgi:hypothetical protein